MRGELVGGHGIGLREASGWVGLQGDAGAAQLAGCDAPELGDIVQRSMWDVSVVGV